MNKQKDFKFFSKLMNHANMGWWKADLTTASYECSGYISELLGLDETGVISFEDFNKRILKEEEHPTTAHSFGVLQMSETVYLFDTVKGPVWIRSKVSFQETDEEGNKKVYGIAEVQDGPDMATAYQALRYSERLLDYIFKHLPVGLELYNKDGILVGLNDKELEIFHIDRKEDLLGINIFENPIFPEEMKEKLRNNEDTDFTFRYDFSKVGQYYQNSKKEGVIDLATKATILYDDNHNPIGYLLINSDKTEPTVVYDKPQDKARREVEVSDCLKSAFLANISHEIRTPLNAIVGFSSLLASTENMAEKEFYNSQITHNSQLLLNLINDVLDLSKIESGYLELHPDWFNLADLFDESVSEYACQIPSGIELRANYPQRDFLVNLDRTRIKQVLDNFLSNALKNTTCGHIEIFYEVDSRYVRIGVRDTGCGIPQNMKDKIFERFEKIDSFIQGAGLGLSICKSIVDKMNGRILIDSQLGIGSTFLMELPYQSVPV